MLDDHQIRKLPGTAYAGTEEEQQSVPRWRSNYDASLGTPAHRPYHSGLIQGRAGSESGRILVGVLIEILASVCATQIQNSRMCGQVRERMNSLLESIRSRAMSDSFKSRDTLDLNGQS